MMNPGALAAFMGFTEPEVADLCETWHMPLDDIKQQYDGYPLSSLGSIYCPESVVEALTQGVTDNYWAGTSGFEIIADFLRAGMPGLREKVEDLLSKQPVKIDPVQFSNNVNTVYCVDDVFTLLVHFGYLAYDRESQEVRIPNCEVKGEFARALKAVDADAFRELANKKKGGKKHT